MNSRALILLVSFLFLFACVQEVNQSNDLKELFVVSRVIDGDTIVLASGEKVRLLGINTPEKKDYYYLKAKQKLRELVEGKTIELVFGKTKYDKYGRILAFVFVDELNVNVLMVRLGLASTYMLDNIPFRKELIEGEKFAKKNELGLWSKSNWVDANCLKLIELNAEKEFLKLNNSCNHLIDLNGVSVKDAGRNKYVFNKTQLDFNQTITIHSGKGLDYNNNYYWNTSNVWNNNGDQLFIRDTNGGLIIHYEY